MRGKILGYNNDSMTLENVEEVGVNVIVPHFDIPTPVEITYCSKPTVTPIVICLPGPIPYKSD